MSYPRLLAVFAAASFSILLATTLVWAGSQEDVMTFIDPNEFSADVDKQPQVTPAVPEGYSLHGAEDWYEDDNISGEGINVGILDFGFMGIDGILGQTELPPLGEINRRCYTGLTGTTYTNEITTCAKRTTHGTEVTEALIDMAPDVNLYIANPQTRVQTNHAVDWMIQNDVKVINYSVGWEPKAPGNGESYPDSSNHSLARIHRRSGE